MSNHVPGEKIALAQFFHRFVPDFKGRTYRPFLVKISPWSHEFTQAITDLGPKRAYKRISTYLDPVELDRVRLKLRTKDTASIRFGTEKVGVGYKGERGDFCLVGGSLRGAHLDLFYRRLELIAGFAYDVVLIDKLGEELDRDWRSVTIHAVQADVYALHDHKDEKEKLFLNLQKVFPC
jgi:hypothetical protein